MNPQSIHEKLNSLKSAERVNATSAVLTAASFYIGQQCKRQNDEFMMCKKELVDPEKCLEKGVMVSKCVNDVLSKLHETCKEEFTSYWQCLDLNNQQFLYCRNEEKVLSDAVKERLGWKKQLWVGFKPEHGFKADNDLPGADTWQYRFYVRFNKA